MSADKAEMILRGRRVHREKNQGIYRAGIIDSALGPLSSRQLVPFSFVQFLSLRLILLGALVLLTACRNKPTVEECTQSFENFIRLQAPNEHTATVALEAARGPASQQLARLCTEKKSRARVLCEIKARTIPDLSDCTSL
ncbi:MAG: hypothetical protein K8S54_05070 [Spirochaetia bacterium]|nr:hypothetical protein [Spirochaetia bacterium]